MADFAYLDEHRGYIGTSGSGKSTTARDDVEQMLRERRHTAIVDVTGIWYGLRSDRAGTGPGFDIPIFGGRRGDVPIGAGDGAAIGKIVGDGVSAIVDLSSLRTGKDQREFMADFIAAIRAKPPGHFQLVCDEADEYVPEKGGIRDAAHQQVAEDMIWIAKRGRTDGYVLSLITQRLADVANAAFSQVQTIFAHQLTAPTDMTAFGKYVRAHGTRDEFAEIMAGLPSLQVGQRYLYRPRLHILELGVSPLPATFDSSRTPGPGEARREPKLLSQIDVGAIAKALAKPREEAAAAAYAAGAEAGQLLVEKDARIRALEDEAVDLEQRARQAEALLERRTDMLTAIGRILVDDEVLQPGAANLHPDTAGTGVEASPAHLPPAGGEEGRAPTRRTSGPSSKIAPDTVHPLATTLGERMAAIAPAKLTWRQLASMCGYSPDGGYFRAGRRDALNRGLLIEEGEHVRAPGAGGQPLTAAAAFELWARILPQPAPKIMGALRGGGLMYKGRLAAELGYSPDGGFFRRGLALLRQNNVTVETGDDVALARRLPGEASP